jgi:hypothetical protein
MPSGSNARHERQGRKAMAGEAPSCPKGPTSLPAPPVLPLDVIGELPIYLTSRCVDGPSKGGASIWRRSADLECPQRIQRAERDADLIWAVNLCFSQVYPDQPRTQ